LAGYAAGLRRISRRGAPRAMTGLGRGANERSEYSAGVNAVATCRKQHEHAAGMLVMREDRASRCQRRPAKEMVDRRD
jgi:hypothetical protein